MWSRLRRAFGIPTVDITDAIRAARTTCEREGWPWLEPVRVEESPINYWVRTNASSRGGNCNFVVGMSTGEVKKAAFARR